MGKGTEFRADFGGMATGPRIRRISGSTSVLGEGPLWDERLQRLYWVDIEGGAVHCCAADGSDAAVWQIGEKIGCIAFRHDRPGFVGGLQSSIATFTLDPLTVRVIAVPETAASDNRCNDGKCDSAGRFWVGTCDQTGRNCSGYLYRVDPDHRVVRAAGPFICTNGPAFAPDGQTLYCVDSYGRTIFAFDIDPVGNLSRRRILIRFEDPAWGYPDGLTCDSTGCIWVAHWGGWRVSRFSAEGKLLETIPVPVSQPTSCTFGGAKLNTLFITSASLGLAEGVEPHAGAVFSIDVGVEGRPSARYGG
jgi:sugar lactone lactonase YvrE